MAYKRYRKRKFARKAKKGYRRRKKDQSPVGGGLQSFPSHLVNLGNGFPLKLKVNMKFSEYPQLTSNSGSMGQYAYRMNSIYDPNFTGTGVQPMYMDQLAALYNHYTVIGSRLKVTFTPSVVSSNPAIVGFIADDDGIISYNSLAAVQSSSSCRWKLIPAGSTDPYTLTYNWSAKKTFGGSVMSNNDLSAASNANPTEGSYCNLFANTINGGTQTFLAMVEIEYIVIWTELIQQQYS